MFVINERNIILDHLRRGNTNPFKTSEVSNTLNTEAFSWFWNEDPKTKNRDWEGLTIGETQLGYWFAFNEASCRFCVKPELPLTPPPTLLSLPEGKLDYDFSLSFKKTRAHTERFFTDTVSVICNASTPTLLAGSTLGTLPSFLSLCLRPS